MKINIYHFKFSVTGIIFILLLFIFPAKSQESINAEISDKITLNYDFQTATIGNYVFEATLFLQNPTLIYPLNAVLINQDVISNRLIKLNDSLYSIKIEFDNTEISLKQYTVNCEILAGNDSVCNIILKDIKINSESFFQKEFIIKINTLNNELPYYRFTDFLNMYPNPIYDKSEIKVVFVTDLKDDIVFYIAESDGKKFQLKEFKNVIPGTHTETIPISREISSGSYRIIMKSRFGISSKHLVIVK